MGPEQRHGLARFVDACHGLSHYTLCSPKPADEYSLRDSPFLQFFLFPFWAEHPEDAAHAGRV